MCVFKTLTIYYIVHMNSVGRLIVGEWGFLVLIVGDRGREWGGGMGRCIRGLGTLYRKRL